MQIKRFFAKDTHTALRLVREAMGPEAIIIANRELNDGVEIIASGDYDESQIEQVTAAPQVDIAPESTTVEATAPQSTIDDMRDEISQLRSLLENQLSSLQVSQWRRLDDSRAEVYNQLIELGIEDNLANRLAVATPPAGDDDSASGQAVMALVHELSTTKDQTLEQGGIVVLHGPTGAGKTTTIAKLAAMFSRLHGADGIVMISADNRRIGAHEQLLALGKLLAIPVLHTRSSQELNATLEAIGDKKLVLVDSSGLVQSDLRQPEQLPGMQSNVSNIRHYLVLPAILETPVLNRIVASMANLEMAGCILSKVDEATTLGTVFSTLVQHQIPIAFWTDGQHIHEHFHQATATELVAQAVLIARKQQENAVEFSPLETRGADTESTGLRH